LLYTSGLTMIGNKPHFFPDIAIALLISDCTKL
jgi:hypothetical protein